MPTIRKVTAEQAGEKAQRPAPARPSPLPPLPEDLTGWAWELTERGLRLVCPTEGYVTAWHPADLESACIVEARQIVERDATLLAWLPSPTIAPAAAEQSTQASDDTAVFDDAVRRAAAVGMRLERDGIWFKFARPDGSSCTETQNIGPILRMLAGCEREAREQAQADDALAHEERKRPIRLAIADLEPRGYQFSVVGPNAWDVWVPGAPSAVRKSGAEILALAQEVTLPAAARPTAPSDPWQAPAAVAARERFAALDMKLSHQKGWYVGKTGPMSWPQVEKTLERAERERARSAQATPMEPPPTQAPAAPAPVLVDLAEIADNPYQPRLSYDPERIAAIAVSIQEHGLLQVPLARRVGQDRYELAFGHSRLRAYAQLAERDAVRFGRMPLVVRDLDDQAMALHAWIENRDRKDLTVYEEAKAIERYTTTFGWSQKQAAEKLQLDRSTVANKLRLLKLPESALKQLQDGTISERQAMALLPLADLPEDLRTSKRRMWLGHDVGDIDSPDELLTKAPNLDSTRLRRAVESTMNDLTLALAQRPWRDLAWDIADVHAPRCADCPIRIKSSDRCPDKVCAGRKATAWQAQQASAAAAAVDLPTTTHRAYSDRDDLGGVTLGALNKVAAEKKCGNLAVLFDDSRTHYPHQVKGYEHCWIVCGHGPGHRCGCKQALARRADPASGADAKKRHDRKRIKVELMAPAEQAVAAVLAQPTAAVWRSLLEVISYSAAAKVPAGADIPAIQAALATYLVTNHVGYSLDYGYYDSAKTKLAELLRELGATVPWEASQPAPDVCAQTPADASDPLTSIRERLEFLVLQAGASAGLALTPDLIADYRARLAELADELEALSDGPAIDDEVYEALARQVGAVEQALQNLGEAVGASALQSEVAP